MTTNKNSRSILLICFNFFWLVFVTSCLDLKKDYSSVELSSLTPAFTEVTEISNGGNGVITPVGDTVALEVHISLGNAHYLTSKMRSIFLNPNSTSVQSNTIKDRITRRITNQILFLGGSCNRYEGNCANAGHSAAPFKAITNPVRKGYIIRACEEITSQDEAITTAMTNAGLTIMSPANDTTVRTVYNLFYPGRPISSEALNNLMNLHQAAITLKQTPTDAWRFVLYTLCASPMMEML